MAGWPVVTSVTFGAVHLPLWTDLGAVGLDVPLLLAHVVFGFLMGGLRQSTGSCVPGAVVHVSWNTLASFVR